jgi:hypothetical protein
MTHRERKIEDLPSISINPKNDILERFASFRRDLARMLSPLLL